jgi:NTE family protein
MANALVLGGGGPVGVAWEAGVLAGLAESGVDLSTPDRIIGTSAGSLVGARLALTKDAAGLVDATARVARGNDAPPPSIDLESLMAVGQLMLDAIEGGDHTRIAREAGKLALAAETIDEADFIALTGGSLGETWPDADYICTAWEAETGTFRAWDRHAGVSFGRAVSSSCCVPGLFPPVALDGGHYIDGGIISASNAFLAEGHDAVVVLSVLTGAIAGLAEHVARPLRQEVESLRAGGADVEVVEMGQPALDACGGNLMDFAAVAQVADAGRAQGREAADRVGAIWR